MRNDSALILDWLYSLAAERARRRVAVSGGIAVLDKDYPLAYDHNQLVLRPGADLAIAAREAETVLGAVGLAHRKMTVLGAYGADVPGYTRTPLIALAYRGGPPTAPGLDVSTLSLAERITTASHAWRAQRPDARAGEADQLGRRIQTIVPVVAATFLGIRGARGDIAATVDLYLRDGIAQLENLITFADQRNQGFATALLRAALRMAWPAPVFLVAEAEDWPVTFYRRLGFVDLFPITDYLRS